MGKNLLIIFLALGWLGTILGFAFFSRDKGLPPLSKATELQIESAPEPSVKTDERHIPPAPSLEPRLPAEPVRRVLREFSQAPGFEAATIGFCLIDQDPKQPLIAWNAHQAMIPASTLKAITSATALELLGPDYTFFTELRASKAPVSGVLQGDLIVRGGGDPTLPLEALDQWIEKLKKSEVEKIEGRVLADARFFPEAVVADAWDWGDVSNYYGAGAYGLNLNHNRFSVRLRGEFGQRPKILEVRPPLEPVRLINRLRSSSPEVGESATIQGGPYGDELTIRGSVPLGEETVIEGAFPDPPYRLAHILTEKLRSAGIGVNSAPSTVRRLQNEGKSIAPDTELEHLLTRHSSPPLSKIVRHLNEVSDNLEAECLFRYLGIKMGRPSAQVIEDHWEPRGVRFKGLRLEDGSGLARADLVRPLDLAQVLYWARKGPRGREFFDSLNEYGAARWKGGAMSRVRAYTGYIRAKSGKEFTFALMINNYRAPSSAIAEWRSRLVEAVASL